MRCKTTLHSMGYFRSVTVLYAYHSILDRSRPHLGEDNLEFTEAGLLVGYIPAGWTMSDIVHNGGLAAPLTSV
jgi:hypothetical protein